MKNMSPLVIQSRKASCARCELKCEAYVANTINYEDQSLFCPRDWSGKWGPINGYEQTNKPMGFGDVVSAVATPIARVLGLPCVDKTTNTLRPESPCAKRREALNKFIPDVGITPSEKP
jgi:hypothetical protein